ncbi:hypothetical protein FACS1894139_00410 [Planctomycetales bacterium]|nr:hypothetical protein FACS1894107_01280 [Planctomycetales bacterium]GHT02384.1 hypothetical protein FACS1894139_00410 [Planctomycetales bacterium]GHV19041.1 hypothetical protein AGMMS49959_02680 [Planctomycetales bacterium]
MDETVAYIHQVRLEIAARRAKMTPEEAAEDHRQSVNAGLRLMGRPEIPPRTREAAKTP